MPRTLRPSRWLLLAALVPGAAAAEGSAPRDGLYEVTVRLELPHLDERATTKQARVCLEAGRDGGTHGIRVLSDNTPFARCPVANPRREGDALRFEIVCEGRNQAHAAAFYRLEPEAFAGRITMRMGGKNMTMTEVQAGRRVGACDGAP